MTEEELRQQAWNFFQMQAGQRLTTFNYYIAISSLLITGLVATFKSDIDIPYLGLAFGLLLILFSFIFWKLDQRNGDLIKGAEEALKYFEKKAPLVDDSDKPHIAKRFSREEYDTSNKKNSNSWYFCRNDYTYSQCFRRVFVIFGCCGFAGLCISIAMIVWK